MRIEECTPADVPVLAQMNLDLIEDERAETNLDLSQLEARMKGFIHSEYKAFFSSLKITQ